MKRYKRILMGFLAATLAAGMIPTNTITASADVKNKTTVEKNTENSDNASEAETTNSDDNEQSAAISSSENNLNEDKTETGNSVDTQATGDTSADRTLDLRNIGAGITEENGKVTSITLNNASQMIKLSNCKPEDLKDLTIVINATGQWDLTVTTDGYRFLGIGTDEYPFCGTIKSQEITFYVTRAFFGALSSTAQITNSSGNPSKLVLNWYGDGSNPMIADTYIFASEGEHSLPATITWGSKKDSAPQTPTAMGPLFNVVKSSSSAFNDATLKIGSEVTYGDNLVEVTTQSHNAGLICNTLENGTICLDGYEFPQNKSYTVKSTAAYDSNNASAAGNAGGVIGVMQTGTTLNFNQSATIKINEANDSDDSGIVSTNGNAGGLVGLMEQGAKIITADNTTVTMEAPGITGGMSAGGVVGMATDVTFADADLKSAITVKNPTVKSASTKTVAVGGFVGAYTLNADKLADTENVKLPDQIVIDNPKLTANNSGNGFAGGYFGTLRLNGTLTYTISGKDSDNKTEITPTYENCNAEAIGAIAGKVTSNTIASTLLVQNIRVDAINFSDVNVKYHGGLIGELGINDTDGKDAAYLKVSDTDIKVKNPYAQDTDTTGFGGIVGLLARGSILQTEGMVTVSTPNDDGNACGTQINRGGGLVGYADKSVINVKGTTDLSGVGYGKDTGKNAKTGWLVGRQDSALLYANGDGNGNGWTYIRGKENTTGKQAMNDIGNYGQIIRLHSGSSESKLSENLISIDENHAIRYSSTLSGDNITLDSEDAFAQLSIAWNTRGYFGGVSGITSDNFSASSPRSKNITLLKDIDLTGSGMTGLTRDAYDDKKNDNYSGTFDGSGKTIILAIGETFGYLKDKTNSLATAGTDGYGEVISAGARLHGRQGIFAIVTDKAIIKNVTVEGSIYVSNAGKDILAGGIAGEIVGGTVTALGVTVKETILADCANDDYMIVGGFYGGSYAGGTKVILGGLGNKDTLNIAAATIEMTNCENEAADTKICAGGVIGEVGESSFTFEINQLTVKGSVTTDASKRAYIGGLIGIIKGSGFKPEEGQKEDHQVQIKGVSFDGFTINAPDAEDVCGGLFGSIWANVGVYFMQVDGNDGIETKLDVKDAKITAPNAANVGGLAYRSSGRWEIRDHGINIEKLSVTAGKNVGLLVCKGESKTDTVAGADRAHGALYLSTTKYWDSAYKIDQDNVTIKTTDTTGVFDEFVAYTTSASDNITENNVNGVISIATKDDGSNGRVGVDTSGCTTYQNRTTYGKTYKINACSRYYYDLDQCLTDMNGKSNKRIDTPQELLLWSVYNYACENIKNYFAKGVGDITNPPNDGNGNTLPWVIGETTSLDMTKYSYYPIKYSSGSVTISNTEIIFNNKQIEMTETAANNKSTQGTAGDHTQHYTMHSGLFLTYETGNGTLSVNNVTFSGSLGKVNGDRSGVLVCDFATGNRTGDTTSPISININGITLNGLNVYGCGESYAPLLINRIGRNTSGDNYIYGYTTLTVNNVGIKTNSYTTGKAVASSLIGDVGAASNREITMSFLEIILPDKQANGTDGIFSHATLLERYAYASDDNASGATYNFNSEEDWKNTKHIHNVTYGKEIINTNEFKNDDGESIQKWYYNESTYRKDAGLVYDDENKKTEFDSSGYLPYVYVAYNKDNCTHEIKVNQRVTNIINGCGTYGHPYRITNEQEMEILSEYMSTGQPRKDWRVKITNNPNTPHVADDKDTYISSLDVIYQYNGTVWVQVENKAGEGEEENWQPVSGNITLERDFMLNYLLNAYYDIQGSESDDNNSAVTGPVLSLTNFSGFGTTTNPFRGVITSKNNTTIVLKGERTANGLIPYSYGSVVRNLTIFYDETAGKTLNYGENGNSSKYYPDVCFGGVIGCVLGGDNIIDHVTVSTADDWRLIRAGSNKHLIQIGGYVGSVSGGGVIFRNMTDGTGLDSSKVVDQTEESTAAVYTETIASMDIFKGTLVLADSSTKADVSADALLTSEQDSDETGDVKKTRLYVNPYVGRVLDGFALYEKASTEDGVQDSLDNTNKNYQINKITPQDETGSENQAHTCVSASGNTITVNDAQGLLLLSAIVNSGAASNGISNAYSRRGNSDNIAISYTTTSEQGGTITYTFGGRYGKVRNASYEQIGESADLNGDAGTSSTEDKKVPGTDNLPYLIQKYCDNSDTIFGASTKSDIEIGLSETGTFNMTGYGNGYQGIAARYVSNAVRGLAFGESNVVNHSEGVIPELKSFNGNGKIVTMNMDVREYADDDFHAASVGGLFNVLRVAGRGNVSAVTIDKKPNVSETINSNVSLTYYGANGQLSSVKDSWITRKDVGVGGLAGSLVGYTDKDGNRDITIAQIQLNHLTITSPASAGGIVGNTGKPIDNAVKDKTDTNDIVVLLQPKDSQIAYGTAFNDCSFKDLTVTGKYAAGGFVGYIGNKEQNPGSTVNANGTSEAITNIGESSEISATDTSSMAGGLFGFVDTRVFINMTEDGTKNNGCEAILQLVNVQAGTSVGGYIGYINEKCYGIHNVKVKGTESENVQIKLLKTTLTGDFYAGGIVGYAKGTGQGWTPNWTYAGGISSSSVENVKINDSDYATEGNYSGTGSIQTNYIAGGMIGQAAGGQTNIKDGTVSESKIYGSVAAGIVGRTDSEMQFFDCTVTGISKQNKSEIKGFSTAGGILGFWTGGNATTIQNNKLQYLDIEGKDWGVGALIGDADGGGVGTLYLFDTSAQDSDITALGNRGSAGGRWPCVGSIIGNLRNTIKASNVLFSDVTLDGADGKISKVTKGLLFGSVTSNNIAVNIAGISIQNVPKENKDWLLTGGGSVTTDNDYIAFADYSGTALDTSETSLAGKSNNLLDPSSDESDPVSTVDPYVVTSPESALAVWVSDSVKRLLYSDGASWEDTGSTDSPYKVKAQQIWDDNKKNSSDADNERYVYKRFNAVQPDTVTDFDFNSVISTYKANQTGSETTDFPVVQVANGNADVVKDYLNIVTNGGFSDANTANKSKKDVHVSAKAEVYKYENGKFVKDVNQTPAFSVKTDSSTQKISFSTTTDYDNDKNRFTLLTVTFTEGEHSYNVFVPVLVRRMLEMDFTATLTYGTDFKKSNYNNLSNHVLESYGSSISGYLTYTYNSDSGTYADYGWQSYINAGGNLMDMKKSIKFTTRATNLPADTQLTLVDEKTGKAYYYTATGQETYDDNGIAIPLGSFTDSESNPYQEPSISELIGVSVAGNGDNPIFVKVDADGKPEQPDSNITYPKPTIRIQGKDGYEYYRLAVDGVDGTDVKKYSVTVDESKLKEASSGKSTVTENYYLVVTVPKNDTTTSSTLNGSLQTTVTSSIPHQVHYQKLVYDNTNKYGDNHDNTASTYQLSDGYQQNLTETGNDSATKKITMDNTKLTVDVTDQITFPLNQSYNANDELYLRFVGGLKKTVDGVTSAEQFPSGTTGQAKFYVYTVAKGTSEKTYYSCSFDATTQKWVWEIAQAQGETIAKEYPWTSDGGNMELPLSEDGTIEKAISLQSLRDLLVKSSFSGGIYVQVKLDATMPASGLTVIPQTTVENGEPNDYAQLTYFSQISTVKQSLSYSSNRASASGTTKYYRDEPTGVSLTYDADEIGQLGINLADLDQRYLDANKTHSLIDTTAVYDLSSMKNLEDVLEKSSGIRFTLTLAPKNKDSNLEGYQGNLTDADNYMSVELKQKNVTAETESANGGSISYDSTTGTWSWTVDKDEYWDSDLESVKKTDSAAGKTFIFDGSKLTQAIQLKVNVNNVEDASMQHLYSNYKVVLTAEILQSDGSGGTKVVSGSHQDAYIIYTFAKIKPDFVK